MPSYFPSVFGNAAARRYFGEAVRGGTLSHAYIFEGPRGSGKTLFATEIAAALICEARESAEILPCGVCGACRRVREGLAPDVRTVATDAATIGVDTVRELRADMYLSACEFPCKIYIVREAHKMTTQAQNALLKVLEEPPTDLYIFLLTERAEALLTTIRSRTQLVRMELLSPDAMEEALAKNVAARRYRERDPDGFRALLEGSGGALGQVLDLLDGKRSEAYGKRHAAVSDAVRKIITSAPASEVIAALGHLPQKRPDLVEALGFYIAALRDLILVYRGENISLTFYTSREEAENLASRAGLTRLLKIYDLTVSAADALAANANVQLTLASFTTNVACLS